MRRGLAGTPGIRAVTRVSVLAALVLAGLVLAVAAGAPAPAVAAAPLALPNEALLASGAVTLTWHGDPTRGCAAAGLCDVEGALIIDAQGEADLSSPPGGGGGFINLDSSSITVRVLTGAGGECVDVPVDSPGAFALRRPAHGRLSAVFAGSLSSGRCAGPTAGDLTNLSVPVRESGGKLPSVDLRTTRPFIAGPFSGELVSTVVLRPDRSGGFSSESSGSSSGSAPHPPLHNVLVERVSLRYRVSSLPGALETSFSGEPDPFCTMLDSCGSSGTVALSLAPGQKTLTLTASRVVPRRVAVRQVLADLRHGRLTVGGLAMTASLQTAETFVYPDGSRCGSSLPGGRVFVFGAPRSGTRFSAVISQEGEGDVLRTYCPGPSETDVFGSDERPVARGSIDVARLLDSSTVISLTNPGAFSGVGYVGSRSGTIGLSLALERVRAGTVSEKRSLGPPERP